MEKGKVLILDDVSSHLLLLQSILEEEGYEALIYSDQEKAIERLYQGDIHIMLLDIMMPEIDGFQVLDRIKKDSRISNTHVIIISAKTDAWSIKNSMEKGAFDYLTKPINMFDLRNKVRAAMNEKI